MRAAGLAARTRRRRSTTSTPSVISSITSRFSCACWRAISRLPRAAISSRTRRDASSPASSAMTNRPIPANPACGQHGGALAPYERRMPRHQQQQQGHRGRGRERPHARGQHARHQHRQHEQGGEVEARARLQQVQGREGEQVDTDRGEPLAPAPTVVTCGSVSSRKRGSSQSTIDCTAYKTHTRATAWRRARPEQADRPLRRDERDADHGARRSVGAPDAQEGTVLRRRDAARFARHPSGVARTIGRAPGRVEC